MAVTSIEIKERGPYAEGMSYGDVGAFEQLDGTVHFAVRPIRPRQQSDNRLGIGFQERCWTGGVLSRLPNSEAR